MIIRYYRNHLPIIEPPVLRTTTNSNNSPLWLAHRSEGQDLIFSSESSGSNTSLPTDQRRYPPSNVLMKGDNLAIKGKRTQFTLPEIVMEVDGMTTGKTTKGSTNKGLFTSTFCWRANKKTCLGYCESTNLIEILWNSRKCFLTCHTTYVT